MKSVLVLTLIGFFSAFLLYGTDRVTREPIKRALERVKVEALKSIFPFDFSGNDISRREGENGVVFYEIRQGGKLRGVAVEISGDKGYGGTIKMLAAVSPDGRIFNYSILSHHETPGLGTKMTEDFFKKQFRGKSLENFAWKVKKDGGEVDSITAATITSRAVTDILKRALEAFSGEYGGGK